MHEKLTITVDEKVYEGLHRVVGRQRISQFIERLVRPHVSIPWSEERFVGSVPPSSSATMWQTGS
ncbi:MAG: hypothetical protein ACRDSJ_19455 [Rubrobacteraceae bacterium]